jgi:hypothetical protein
MGENITQTFVRHHTIDINIKCSAGNNFSVTICPETGSGMKKLLIFSRNLKQSASLYK